MNGTAGLTDDEDLPDVPAVEFGATEAAVINYLSVSQAKTAADWAEGGCFRKWYLKKVVGLEEPQRGSQELGKEVHAQLEHYMKTGQDVLGDIARAALPYLREPKTTKCEVSITETNRPKITGAQVFADGIPLVGFIDRIDIPFGGPIRVVDYKTSSNPEKYAATPEQLSHTDNGAGIQMVGYAVAVANRYGLMDDDPIELEHLYLKTKPTKADVAAGRHVKQVVGKTTAFAARVEWEGRMDPLANRLRQVVRAKSLDEVAPNWNACGAFGGCHFYSTCLINEAQQKPVPKVTHMSLSELLKSRREAAAKAAPIATPAAKEDRSNSPEMTSDARKLELELLAAAKAADEKTQPDAAPLPQVVPPDAPASRPELAAEAPPEPAPPPAEKKPRARKPKAEPEHVVVTYNPDAESKPGGMFALFVDCIPSSGATAAFSSYVADRVAEISKAFPELIDIRIAPKKGKNAEGKDVDHPLAYGAWKGVLASQCKLNPPTGNVVALGVYGSEFMQVAIEALEPLAALVVRGVR